MINLVECVLTYNGSPDLLSLDKILIWHFYVDVGSGGVYCLELGQTFSYSGCQEYHICMKQIW